MAGGLPFAGLQEVIAVETMEAQNIRNDICLLASAGGIQVEAGLPPGLHDNGVDSKEVDAGSQGDLEEQQVGIFYGWSPWGSNTMLVREQALDLQKQITQVCWERMHEVEWVPPVKYSNFRLAFRIKRGYDRSARSERGHGFELVQWIRGKLDRHWPQVAVHGDAIKVRLQPGAERREWNRQYFACRKAVQDLTRKSEHEFDTEISTYSCYWTGNLSDRLFKLRKRKGKGPGTLEFSAAVLRQLGITEAEVCSAMEMELEKLTQTSINSSC